MTETERIVNEVLDRAEQKARKNVMDTMKAEIDRIRKERDNEIEMLGLLATQAEMMAYEQPEESWDRASLLRQMRKFREAQSELIVTQEAPQVEPYAHQELIYTPAMSRRALVSIAALSVVIAALLIWAFVVWG